MRNTLGSFLRYGVGKRRDDVARFGLGKRGDCINAMFSIFPGKPEMAKDGITKRCPSPIIHLSLTANNTIFSLFFTEDVNYVSNFRCFSSANKRDCNLFCWCTQVYKGRPKRQQKLIKVDVQIWWFDSNEKSCRPPPRKIQIVVLHKSEAFCPTVFKMLVSQNEDFCLKRISDEQVHVRYI